MYLHTDPAILAVGPGRYREWLCGTVLEIVGPGGTLRVARTDACPGCADELVDLSEAGSMAVCGAPRGEQRPRPHTCRVTIRVVW